MQEIQLVEGRGHPGQAWILKFNKIDSVDQVFLELFHCLKFCNADISNMFATIYY